MLPEGIYDVTDYASVQDALDAMALAGEGGILLLPPRVLNQQSTPAFTGAVVNSPNVTIRGTGASVLQYLDNQDPVNTHMIELRADRITLEDFAIIGKGEAGAGIGIIDQGITPYPDENPRHVVGHCFRRLVILNTPSWGIVLIPTADTPSNGGAWDIELDHLTIYDAKSGGSFQAGSFAESTFQINCWGCSFNGPGFGTYGNGSMDRGAVHLINSTNISFYNCFFQPKDFSTSISLHSCNNIRVLDAHFESAAETNLARYAITTSGNNGRLIVDNATFYRFQNFDDPRIFKSDSSESSILDFVFRDSSIVHGVVDNPPPSDIDFVFGNAVDSAELVNLRLYQSNGSFREIYYTDRAGVVLRTPQSLTWQFRLPPTGDTDDVVRPTDGALIRNAATEQLEMYSSSGVWKPILQILTTEADDSNGTTSGKDIPGLSMPIGANQAVHFHAYLIASASQDTTGIRLGLNGPGSPGSVDATILGWTSVSTSLSTGVDAYETYQANTTSNGTSRRVYQVFGRVLNGATQGTVALRYKSEVTLSNAVTIHQGSWVQFYRGPH